MRNTWISLSSVSFNGLAKYHVNREKFSHMLSDIPMNSKYSKPNALKH